MAQLLLLNGLFVGICCFFAIRKYLWRKTCPKLPPGPKPLPIVGNILDLPPKDVPEFQHWLKHKDAYGPISSVSILGQTLVILHDKQAARDLLEKRSKVCSGRPRTEFGGNLCGYGNWVVMQQNDDVLRRCRKLMHQRLGTKQLVAADFSRIQEEEVHRFLFRMLNNPETLVKHLKTTASAIISKVVYGYTIEPHKGDPLVELVELNMSNAQRALTPGGWLVDAFPALKYLPSGFPGTGFKKTARQWSEINQMATEAPYAFVQRQVEVGNYRPSFVSTLVKQFKNSNVEAAKLERDEHDAKWSAAMLYNGGLDTTVAILSGFVMAMAMFPQAQRRAQEEIDRVVGVDRLPGFEDWQKLPYIRAVVQEAFRWNPTAPLGFPHMVSEDTTYNGYLLPKGAVIFSSIWWFCHDPEVHAEPDVFNPERFLEPRNEPNPITEVFGYGRRVCPGQHLAEASVYLTIAQTLAAFSISKATDRQGREIEIQLNTNTGLINRPVDFPYKITPRSEKYADLIKSVEVQHPFEESDADLLGVPHF
ncbi:Cytochrome P450 [Metarhizium rileyi]|uniref:Cytochrome P450 n=1 Tax=Metarhizium rileyi (strain RCEF 4871) TaxID=1649241 RepID=A0A166Y3A7_METRR|nr:Cytochrome P450 [Metarhizium rileyi RCEF 4871]